MRQRRAKRRRDASGVRLAAEGPGVRPRPSWNQKARQPAGFWPSGRSSQKGRWWPCGDNAQLFAPGQNGLFVDFLQGAPLSKAAPVRMRPRPGNTEILQPVVGTSCSTLATLNRRLASLQALNITVPFRDWHPSCYNEIAGVLPPVLIGGSGLNLAGHVGLGSRVRPGEFSSLDHHANRPGEFDPSQRRLTPRPATASFAPAGGGGGRASA